MVIVTTNGQSQKNMLRLRGDQHFDALILVLCALRVYALCRRNNVVLYVASTLILARFGVDIWVGSFYTDIYLSSGPQS